VQLKPELACKSASYQSDKEDMVNMSINEDQGDSSHKSEIPDKKSDEEMEEVSCFLIKVFLRSL
jgi:hypothetical protein